MTSERTEIPVLKLKVSESLSRDVGRGIARLGPEDLETLQVVSGDLVEVSGKRGTVCKVMPAYRELRGQSRIQIDGLVRENAGAGLDEFVQVRKITCSPARRIVLAPANVRPSQRDLDYIANLLDGLPVQAGNRIRATLFGSRWADFRVESTTPKGPVLINSATELVIGSPQQAEEVAARSTSYEDIGGLKPQLHRIREMIELPLRYPEVFERRGIDGRFRSRGPERGRQRSCNFNKAHVGYSGRRRVGGGEYPAQDPKRVGHVALRQPRRPSPLRRVGVLEGPGRYADVALGVAVGARELAVAPPPPHGRQAETAETGGLRQAHLAGTTDGTSRPVWCVAPGGRRSLGVGTADEVQQPFVGHEVGDIGDGLGPGGEPGDEVGLDDAPVGDQRRARIGANAVLLRPFFESGKVGRDERGDVLVAIAD